MENLDYGVIGNCTSSALISKTGAIEWCCLPYFNSQSVFAKILDIKRGGQFSIDIFDGSSVGQRYISKTNILSTLYKSSHGELELLDFMPRYSIGHLRYHCPPDIIRYIRVVSGRPKIKVHYDPRPCYGQYDIKTEVREEYIKTSTVKGSYESVYLYSDLDLQAVHASKTIELTGDCFFLLSYNQKLSILNMDFIELEFEKTKVYWMNWIANTQHFNLYNQEIQRSALILKLLTYQRTGAILAAMTTSLPEEIGSERNWDYRFCWIRDASMSVAVLTKLGHFSVARRFLKFILNIIPYKDEKIQILYGINGDKKLTEKMLADLDGYFGSKPVRIGNAAYTQKQNDIFGLLLDTILQYFTLFKREAVEEREDLWTIVRTVARHVEKTWHQKDSGIWEFRTSKKHFVFSKMLNWVAMDRAMRIATYFGKDDYAAVWRKMKAKIKTDIFNKGWDEKLGAFTQAYGEPYLDAANLMMEHYGFIDASDPRYVSTVLMTYRLLTKNGLMYRYRNEDDFGAPKSSFTVCTFWLIKSLYRIGEKNEAVKLFEKVLSYSNHVGLLSEDIDFESKRLLGNFPQAYSHLALIDTAITLGGEDVLPHFASPALNGE